MQAVEPICKANTEANEKILKGVRAKVKAGKLDAAATQFAGAARALKRTRAQPPQVPQPPADAAPADEMARIREDRGGAVRADLQEARQGRRDPPPRRWWCG